MTDDVGGARRGGKRVGLAGRGRTSRGGGSPPRRWCGWRPRRIRGGCWNGGRRRRRSGSRRSPGAQPASSRMGRGELRQFKVRELRGRRFARAARLGVGDDARTDARAIRGRRDVDGGARARTRGIRRGRRAPSGDPRGVPRRLKHGAIVPVGAPASRRRGPTRGPPRRGSPPGGGTAPEPRGRSERQTSRAEGRVASPRRPVGYDARARPRHPDEDSRGAVGDVRGGKSFGTDGTRIFTLDVTRQTPSIFPRCAKIPRHVRLGPNAKTRVSNGAGWHFHRARKRRPPRRKETRVRIFEGERRLPLG